MSESVVAKRYAEALFQLGEEKDLLDQYVEDLKLLREVLQDNDQLLTVLNHPRIRETEKQDLIKEIFKDLQKDILNTILLLVERKRIDLMPEIIEQLIKFVNDAKGIAEATVYSVRELSDEEKEALGAAFSKRFNKQDIQFTNIVDPSILGGLRLRIGNTIYDGTISSKLNRLERNIVTANK